MAYHQKSVSKLNLFVEKRQFRKLTFATAYLAYGEHPVMSLLHSDHSLSH